MNSLKSCVKTIALVGAIAAGMALTGGKARAQDQGVLTVAGGCFWCVEADFEKVQGVSEAVSGYTGGTTENPTYREVSRGGTGHYEAVEIMYDPSVVDRRQLLDLFFRSIDPTDAGGQFCDRGESYRTAVFVGSEEERQVAEAAKAAAEEELGQEIVTPILDLQPFYIAEDKHQDYYKGSNLILTRGGPKRQSEAYDFYREGCGRDARIEELWGSDAPFLPAS
ncbi:peptide-methionine (S)-S-oxide reductase MsrA [Pelagovum pacificum]|uniref:Peptide methionine sulfoxide reductase MsrA n=1 Tax=Pelagovum pacificum TaxID=2588711 RepID=A0A5C5GJH6_9RHOB|nr:peptide-methionine (S)-S-oxide reductase MsrA [Pelagovum pacificum]QQA42830.1 peptide-methionine (S)-S-oxide reductase MsrA [Pelagovum pacificum]TNY34021.1 peptide-methionine (S)-S-oxide reductase MsrA [Pelagovum pacificum]